LRIVIVTDAWFPMPNGVVRVLSNLRQWLVARGHEVRVISPDLFRTVPCPGYAELPLAVFARGGVGRLLAELAPDAVHIATEGPLGRFARAWCLKHGFPFTTAYHTKFPEYIKARSGLPLDWLYAAMRRFHGPSRGVLVPSPSVHRELLSRGFANLRAWTHGVDTQLFRPRAKDFLDGPRPIQLFVGRLAVEKNLHAFLDLELEGSKVVVGSGPLRQRLIRQYPRVRFQIAANDDELSRYFAAADVLVFPSLTDTFGLVMLEALASGVPVAAFPVTGPRDVIGESGTGCLSEDLAEAARRALEIPPERCRAYAETFSWETVAAQFLDYLAPVSRPVSSPAPAGGRGSSAAGIAR